MDNIPKLKLTAIVPYYNELETLEATIHSILKLELGIDLEIIAVDDGSTDGSSFNISPEEETAVKLLNHPTNKGKGAAIRTALEHVTGDIVVIQDADMEYNPEEWINLIPYFKDGSEQVVYGSRFMGNIKAMTFKSKIANLTLTRLTNLLFRSKLTDMETCMKMFKYDLIKSLKLESNDFRIEPELTSIFLKKEIHIKEVPINYTARSLLKGKKIKPKDGFLAIVALFKFRFKKLSS